MSPSSNTTVSHFTVQKPRLANTSHLFSGAECETSRILEHSSVGIPFDAWEDSYVQILTKVVGQCQIGPLLFGMDSLLIWCLVVIELGAADNQHLKRSALTNTISLSP